MVSALAGVVGRVQVRSRALMWRWRRDESGFTAVEFALIAGPFLMLLFGIISICFYFFTNFTLENAVWQAARAIRTGQMQQGTGAYKGTTTNEDKKKEFKKAVCAKAPIFLDCNSKAVVIVQSNANFASITEPQCANNGNIISEASASFNAGGTSAVVLATVCYPWAFGGKLPFFKFGNLADGSVLLQASAAFRTEPY
jgi:Flp pilus assembly protein TadG